FLQSAQRRVARRAQAISEHWIVGVACRGGQLQLQRGEMLCSRVMKLARECRALTVTSRDDFGRQRAKPRSIRLQTIEQQIEHRSNAEHFAVGNARSFDARTIVALPDP